MAINNWPAADRPREKLLASGPASLTDAELLAIFLRTGVAGYSAVDLARASLEHFGGLRQMLSASQTHFCSVHGMGEAKYAQLQASLEMARRHLLQSLQRSHSFEDPRSVKDFLTLKLRDEPHELFAALFLDNHHRLIQYEVLFRGTINATAVYPREVVKAALSHNAAACVLAHNHPSGVAEPSQQDENITKRLNQALQLVEIRLLDHFIVGDQQVTSFAERGML